jgi:ketosteroid isomerase-like protein
MKRKNTKRDEMRDEYTFDYSKAVRGKHFQRLMKEGANVVVLEPDVAKVFRGSAAVNDALRSLLQVSKTTLRLTSRSILARRKRAAG